MACLASSSGEFKFMKYPPKSEESGGHWDVISDESASASDDESNDDWCLVCPTRRPTFSMVETEVLTYLDLHSYTALSHTNSHYSKLLRGYYRAFKSWRDLKHATGTQKSLTAATLSLFSPTKTKKHTPATPSTTDCRCVSVGFPIYEYVELVRAASISVSSSSSSSTFSRSGSSSSELSTKSPNQKKVKPVQIRLQWLAPFINSGNLRVLKIHFTGKLMETGRNPVQSLLGTAKLTNLETLWLLDSSTSVATGSPLCEALDLGVALSGNNGKLRELNLSAGWNVKLPPAEFLVNVVHLEMHYGHWEKCLGESLQTTEGLLGLNDALNPPLERLAFLRVWLWESTELTEAIKKPLQDVLVRHPQLHEFNLVLRDYYQFRHNSIRSPAPQWPELETVLCCKCKALSETEILQIPTYSRPGFTATIERRTEP
eukprot:TRINITY_DN61980_c0_g1_i1.p2 TRINITY_DN61980_c0_g1~~TRINITY_DN61980_c0_g1_i1.p2  ORF type:complete len:430 (+),score=10.48 TRINITY_DN61980_c0_g1_i1:64-1353(+)